MTAGRICCVCDQVIRGDANEIVRHSASGVRPNDYSHKVGDEACLPRRSRSLLMQHMPRHP